MLSPQFDASDLNGTDGCTSYPAGTFSKAIALISRGTCGFAVKVPNAIAAGAIAVIISDNRSEGPFSPTVGPPQVSVPVFSIPQANGIAMQVFLKPNKNTGTASLGYSDRRLVRQSDVLASFSLLGPGDFDVIKPDVAAPGVAVLAAVANDGSSNGPNLVAFYDGTSMATPHITGTGALILGMHPTWTPMEVKSAIMMTSLTSGVTKADGTTAAGFFDVGAGRVQAFQATKAGLVLDETADNMLAAYPDGGGDPSTLNLASLQSSNCAVSCEFTRKVTATAAGQFAVSVSGELASKVTVSPSSFSVAKGDTVDLTIDVDSALLNPGSGFHFATVTIGSVSQGFGQAVTQPDLNLPLAVSVPNPTVTIGTSAVDIALNGTKAGSSTLPVSNPGAGIMTFAASGSGTVQPFVWINQIAGNYYGEPSVHYTAGVGADDTDYYSADDFVITGSDPVNLTSIVTPGFTANHSLLSFGVALGLHWRVYSDDQGVPSSDPSQNGPAVWSFDTTAGNVGVKLTGDTISLDLVAAKQSTALPAGHYWLVVYPDLPCNDTHNTGCTEGWYWLNSWQGSGSTWALTAPGYTWYNGEQNQPYGLGLAMKLTGGAACSMPDWLSLSPSAGAVNSGSSTPVKFSANFANSTSTPPKSAYICLATSYQEPSLGTSIPKAVIPIQVNAH